MVAETSPVHVHVRVTKSSTSYYIHVELCTWRGTIRSSIGSLEIKQPHCEADFLSSPTLKRMIPEKKTADIASPTLSFTLKVGDLGEHC